MNYNKKYIDWNDIEVQVLKIAKDLIKDNVRIDTIVPILKGGFIPSILIGKILNIDTYSCLHIRRSDSNLSNCDFHQPKMLGITTTESLKNKNVLIVEDIVYSGETIKFAIEELKKHGVANIYVCTLYNFYSGNDFGKIYRGNSDPKAVDWIVFPWDYESDYCKMEVSYD